MTLSGFVNTPFDVDIVLDEDPKGAATVRLFPASPTGLVLSPTTLSFDETDWNTPKQVSAVIKQNPLELGGVTNAQVVFAEITTSWGGADNITKDRFRLTVLEQPFDEFVPEGGMTGALPVFQKVGSIRVSPENAGSLQWRARVTGPSVVRGETYEGQLKVAGTFLGNSSTWNIFPDITGSATPWLTIIPSVLEIAFRLENVGALIDKTTGTFDDSCSLGVVVETRLSNGTLLSTVPVGVGEVVSAEKDQWSFNTDSGLDKTVTFDTEPVPVSFSGSYAASWQKTGAKHGDNSGSSSNSSWDLSWTQDGGSISADGTVIPANVGQSRTLTLSSALPIEVDYTGEHYPVGFSKAISTISVVVRATTE